MIRIRRSQCAGETTFTATRETWNYYESVLSTIVGLHAGSGSTGAFIDVDPVAFARVVNYLRRRGAMTPPTDDEALADFAACAHKLLLHRLTAELALEQCRRAWERELLRVEREADFIAPRLAAEVERMNVAARQEPAAKRRVGEA